ncbi:MAG: hypothetical protein ACI4RM_07320 [Ruminococcus sp.]
MRAFKITYLRAGDQEPWAGWRIAGRDPEIPENALEKYSRIQSVNSASGIVAKLYDSASVIWEFICDKGNIYYSKLTYGIQDQALHSRQSMRADGLVFSKSLGLEKEIVSILNIPPDAFDNKTILEEVYPQKVANNEPTINLADDQIVTPYKPFLFDENADCGNISDFFSERENADNFLMCIYWALTSRCATTINLVTERNHSEKKRLIGMLLSYLPYSLRSNMSFRTQDVPGAMPVKLVYSVQVPGSEYYYNIDTGKNNIVSENKLNLRYEKYDFIKYPAEIDSLEKRNEYFDDLHNAMGEFGNDDSTDMNFFQIAHKLVMEKANGDISETEDENLLKKKFFDYLTLPFSNEKIDNICADLLQIIVERDIYLNESIQERVKTKLKETESAKFISIGRKYSAVLMIGSDNRFRQFEYLYRTKSFAKEYDAIRCEILALADGRNFMDEFYGKYYGDRVVSVTEDLEKNTKQLDAFISETDYMETKTEINGFVAGKCLEFGKRIVDNYFEKGTDFSGVMPKYEGYVYKVAQQSLGQIKESVKAYFWEQFDFEYFEYTDNAQYKIMADKSDKCILVRKLMTFFDILQRENEDLSSNLSVTLPKDLLDVLDSHTSLISEKAKDKIIDEFRACCIQNISKRKCIDFWYRVALMGSDDFIDFILANNISVFTDTVVFQKNMNILHKLSDVFKNDENLLFICGELNSYLEKNKKRKTESEKNNYDTVQKMVNVLYEERERREKLYKEYIKKERKIQRKQASDEKKQGAKGLLNKFRK